MKQVISLILVIQLTGATIPVTCNSSGVGTASQIQTAINGASCGDVVELQASNSGNICVWDLFDSGNANQFTVVDKSCPSNNRLTITSENASKLPPDDVAMTAMYIPLLPVMQPTLAKPALAISSGLTPSTGIKVRGIHFRSAITTNTAHTGGLVVVGNNEAYSASTDLTWYPETTVSIANTVDGIDDTIDVASSAWVTGAAIGATAYIQGASGGRWERLVIDSAPTGTTIKFTTPLTQNHLVGDRIALIFASTDHMPDDIIIQHNIFSNFELKKQRAGLTLNGKTITARDNLFDWIMDVGNNDSQGIGGHNGLGPYRIKNNAIYGAAENILLGGTKPRIATEPNSFTIDYNILVKTPERDHIGVWTANRSVFKGLQVYGSALGAAGGYYLAQCNGTTANSEPTWVRTSANWQTGSLTDDGTCLTGGTLQWRYIGTDKHTPKNLLELKSASNGIIEYNGVYGWKNMSAINTVQNYAMTMKATNTELCDWVDTTNDFPTCYGSRTVNNTIRYNYFSQTSGGIIGLAGCTVGLCKESGGYNFYGNYAVIDEAPNLFLFFISPTNRNSTGFADTAWTTNTLNIENNTVLAPSVSSDIVFYGNHENGTNFSGTATIKGNIFPKGLGLIDASSASPDTATALQRAIGCNPCTTSTWNKNITSGADLTNYPSNSSDNGCGATGACSMPSWSTWLRDYPRNNKIKHSSTFARNAYNGADIGANPNAVPRITSVAVNATDRLVLIEYGVTPVIANFEGTVEVSTDPAFQGGYVGEQAANQIGTHYGKERDSYNGYVRSTSKTKRSVIVGHVENLTPETTYYYRITIAGAMRRGSFTTKAAKTGSDTLTIARSGITDVTVGTSYNRSTDTIGDTVADTCAGNQCTVTLTKGVQFFYKVGSGPVRPGVMQ